MGGTTAAQEITIPEATLNLGPDHQQPVELSWLRNETTKVFGNPDGTYKAEVSLEPIHFLQDGKWHDIDNTLVETSDGSTVQNKANRFQVRFPLNPQQAKSTNLFNYTISGHEIAFGLKNNQSDKGPKVHTRPLPTRGEFKGNTLRYKNIFNDVTLEYIVDGSKVKENIILHSYQGKNTFEFFIEAPTLLAEKVEDGSIEFTEPGGRFLFRIPRPYMFDAKFAAGEDGAVSQEVSQDIATTDGGYILTITADESFLTNSGTMYPVTIDPWIDVFNTEDTYIASGTSHNYHNNDHMFVGYHSTIGRTRALAKWNLPDIPNAVVTSAEIGLYQYSSNANVPVNLHRITANYNTTTVTWGTQPSFDTVPETSASLAENSYMYFSVTDLVKNWYNNIYPNQGVLFKYEDNQETTMGRKAFRSTEWSNPDGTLFGKPKLVVFFRPQHLLGITDYWTYTLAQSFGGGTAVVNTINGNLVYDIPLLNLSSRLGAFNTKLVYNSQSPYWDAFSYGWTFSAQRRLIFNSDTSIIEYIDENGTRLHFVKLQHDSATTWTAPEGTFLELSLAGGEYQIKQTDETVLYFDTYGRNTKIVDEKGNTVRYVFDTTPANSRRIIQIQERFGMEATGRNINLTYNADGLLNKITDLRGQEITFAYNQLNNVSRLSTITFAAQSASPKPVTFNYSTSHQLTSIMDANGNTGRFEYDNNKISKIIDPRSSTIFASFAYPTPTETVYTDARGIRTAYFNNSDLNLPTVNTVKIIEDIDGDATTTTYRWSKNNLVEVIEPDKATGQPSNQTVQPIIHTAQYDDKANLTRADSPNNLHSDNTFDALSNLTKFTTNNGRFFNEFTYDAKSNPISSSNYMRLTDYNTFDKYGNLETSVAPTRVTHNRLVNSGFEYISSNLPTTWLRRPVGTYSTLTTDKRFGKRSGAIDLTANEDAGYYYQIISVDSDEIDKNYTLSAYIRTINVTGAGANLRVYYLDSNNNYITDAGGNLIIHTTTPIIGTTGWTRVSNFLQAPANTAKIRVDLLFTGTGRALFDGVSMVYGRVLDEYYSNENASMEWGSGPDTWTLNNIGTGDGKTTERALRGSSSFKLNGTTASKYLGQYVEVEGTAGMPITFSGWAYASGTNPNGGEFGLRLWIMHTDGTEERFDIPFDKTQVNRWQMVKRTVRATKNFNRAKIYGLYFNQTGAAFFDNIKVEERSAVSRTTYDSSGNFAQTETNESNKNTSYTYDVNGNIKSVIDASNKEIRVDYNSLDLLESVTLHSATPSNNISVLYGYDVQGNLKTRTNGLGHATAYDYNELNKSVSETDPTGKFIRYGYDAAGNTSFIESGKGTTIASSEVFEYDQKNRLSKTWLNGINLYTYGYDHANNLTSIQSPNGLYTFTYDKNSRLLSAMEPGFSLINTYDNSDSVTTGTRTHFTETIGSTTQHTDFTYDLLGRVTSITNPRGTRTDSFYNERGLRSRINTAATNIYFDYDDAGRPLSQTAQHGTGRTELAYTYTDNGQLASYREGSNNESYTYDFAKRLTAWTRNGIATQYTYDRTGNLANPAGRTLTFNAANEVATSNGVNFVYDDAGNLTRDDRYNYTWNGEGRLLIVKNLSNTTLASYTYHPNGLRSSKTVGAVTHNYHYDDKDLVRVTGNSGQTVWTITWDNGRPVTLTNQSGASFNYVTNLRGDVVRLTDAAGNVAASYSYDPWGNALSVSENSAVAKQPLRYASYVFDTETGLYYLQARYYDPATARFISRDALTGSMTDPLSQNAYAYANGDPVNNVDPDGNMYEGVLKQSSQLYNYLLTFGVAVGGILGSPIVIGVLAAGAIVAVGYTIYHAKQTSKSGKEKASNAPSWARNEKPLPGEKAEEFTKRILDSKYGKGKWKKGSNTEFNKIKKWATRDLGLK